MANSEGGKSEEGLLPSFPVGEPPRFAFVCHKSEERTASLTRQRTPRRLGIHCAVPVSLAIGQHTLCVFGVGDRPAKSLDEHVGLDKPSLAS